MKHALTSLFIIALLHLNLLASDTHKRLLKPFIGIPYRTDGAMNIDGNYTSFANTHKFYKTPGLNCSGFVLSGVRALLNKKIAIKTAKKDINNNSGTKALLGKDWDFGRDLIQNISKKYKTKYLSTQKINPNSTTSDGIGMRDKKAWLWVLEKIKKQNIYLMALSKKTNLKNYKFLYHHVGIIIKDGNDKIWLYHATRKNGVNKVLLSNDKILSSFIKNYKKTQKALILEVRTLKKGEGKSH